MISPVPAIGEAYGDYQSGNWANGSYNLTCLTHSESANAQDTFNLTQVQNYGQTLVGTFVTGSNGTLTGSSGFNGTDSSLTTVTGTFGYAGTETLTLFTAAQASHALYEAGTSSGGCVALGTITFSRGQSDEFSIEYRSVETWTGAGKSKVDSRETISSGTLSGDGHENVYSAFSYTLAATTSVSSDGESSSSDYRAGVFLGGSYAFGSVVHDEHAEDAGESLFTTLYEYEATQTRTNDRSGLSASGANGTFKGVAASGHATSLQLADWASDFTLHETGSFANGSFNLGCMVLDAAFTWNLAHSDERQESAADGGDYELGTDFGGEGSDGGWWNLHEEGTYSNGTWNLGTFVEQSSRVTAYSEYQDRWTETGAGQYATSVGDGSSASTFNLYRFGSYSNGSWSFASLTLEYTSHVEQSANESGSNDEFSAYERNDAYEYDYALDVVGSGSVGTYTETALETTSRTFDGTYTGGGTISDSSLITLGFTNTGTVSLASGELAFSNVQIAEGAFPDLPPILEGFDFSSSGGAPSAPSFGGGMDGPNAGGGGGVGGSSGGDDDGGQQGGGPKGPGGGGGGGGRAPDGSPPTGGSKGLPPIQGQLQGIGGSGPAAPPVPPAPPPPPLPASHPNAPAGPVAGNIRRLHVPSSDRGKWVEGTRGNGVFEYADTELNRADGVVGKRIRFKDGYIAVGGFPSDAYYKGNARNASIELDDLPRGTTKDARDADKKMRAKLNDPNWKRPDSYVWNHAGGPDSKTMELVQRRVHKTVHHEGPASQPRAQARGTGKLAKCVAVVTVWSTLRDALQAAGTLKPDYDVEEAPYYFVDDTDGSVFIVEEPAIWEVWKERRKVFVAGPRAGQTEDITTEQFREFERIAIERWGRLIPGDIFHDPVFIPGTHRKTLPYMKKGKIIGWVDERGVHIYPGADDGRAGA